MAARNKNSTQSPDSLAAKLARKKELEKEQFAMMKDLYGHYRNGTFLAIDIVGSTRLKEGEDSIRVVQSFQAFHRYINENIYGSLGSVFSGDGVMALFETAQEAVNAALRIFRGLEHFNRHESKLRRYINLRIGINSGTLMIDTSMDIGRLTERNIDIAGHLQKYGDPGQLLISAFTWEQIKNKTEFAKRWKTIDNTVVYRYRTNFTPGSETPPGKRWQRRLGLPFVKLREGVLGIPALLRPKIIIPLVLLALVVGLTSVVYRQWSDNVPESGKGRPTVVRNMLRNMAGDQHLGDAVIWRKGTPHNLPERVFLVIPPGKNSVENKRRGINDGEVIPLRRGGDGRYYLDSRKGLLGQLGILKRYVETYNGYRIFFKRKDAENHIK